MDAAPSNLPPRLAEIFLGRLGAIPHFNGELPEPDEPEAMDAAAVAEFNRRRALDLHHRLAPIRFRDSVADHPAVLDWVTRYLLDPGGFDSLLLQGVVGAGKTHQAYGAFRAIAASGRPPVKWMAITAARLYQRLRPNDANDQAKILTEYSEVPLLLLDDLGASRCTAFTEEVTYQIIDARYTSRLSTIITTNLATDQLFDAVGYRTASRLIEMCTWIQFPDVDLRRNL